MNKIALITMRSDDIDGNYTDSLDRRYYELITQILGEKTKIFPIPNIGYETENYVEKIKPNLIVLSGGNDLSSVSKPLNCDPIRDLSEHTILKSAVNIPVLGICRGMQLMSTFFGSKLTEIDNHVAKHHLVNSSIEANTQTSMLTNSYHKWSVKQEDLAKELVVLHTSGDFVESMKHRVYPWVGVMWHPERSNFNSESRNWVVNEISNYL